MTDRALELFTQAGEEAYKLCKEHNHKVSGVDHIWVSIMAANLAELVARECTAIIDDIQVPDNSPAQRMILAVAKNNINKRLKIED